MNHWLMTVEKPEFDGELEGYASYVVDSVCHAKRTAYDEDGQHQVTECGIRIDNSPLHSPDVQLGARSDFVERANVKMCSKCWPDDIVDGPV